MAEMNEPKSKIKLYSNYFDDKLDKNMPDQLLQEIPVNVVTIGNVTSLEFLKPTTIKKGINWFEIPISIVEPKSELILECCGKPESQCRCDEPKLVERLLTQEEIKQAWLKSEQSMGFLLKTTAKQLDKSVYSFYNNGRFIAEAQLAKDQRFEKILLDEFEKLLIDEKTEHQARVMSMLDFIETRCNACGKYAHSSTCRLCLSELLQALKKREGVK